MGSESVGFASVVAWSFSAPRWSVMRMTSMRVSIATCGSSTGSESISTKSTGSLTGFFETSLELCFGVSRETFAWEAVWGGEE